MKSGIFLAAFNAGMITLMFIYATPLIVGITIPWMRIVMCCIIGAIIWGMNVTLYIQGRIDLNKENKNKSGCNKCSS